MIKFEIKRKKVAVGAAPGTLIYTGSATETSAEIQLIKYNPDHISQSVAHEFAGVMETTLSLIHI